MEFTGQLWFDFRSPDVWMFYRFVRALATSGHSVGLEWAPVGRSDEAAANETFAALDSSTDRGRFLHAMLGLVHLRGADPSAIETVEAAKEAAHVSDAGRDPERADRWRTEARELGVTDVPALYRHGPTMVVRLNQAALGGNLVHTASAILDVADADGIWELTKP